MDKFSYVDTVDSGEYNFGDKLDNQEIRDSLNTLSTISYRYIDFENTEYNFFQDCFDNNDIAEYFSFMNMLTTYPLNTLFSCKEKDWHLYSNDYFNDTRFRNLVNKSLEQESNLKVECAPMFYHFALYTNQGASREKNVKSPRIYFFIGSNAIIYPLFYDPYHEINP